MISAVATFHRYHQSITVLIALVWFVNGLYCKLLNFVPRHNAIVAKIIHLEDANLLTRTIGLFEVLMAVWVISKVYSRWCALTQVLLIACMNLLEFFLASELLLFGKLNIFFATLLIGIIIANEGGFTRILKLNRRCYPY